MTKPICTCGHYKDRHNPTRWCSECSCDEYIFCKNSDCEIDIIYNRLWFKN